MDAVIIETARTPIGRAFKGSLRNTRPEQLAGAALKSLLAKVPELDPTLIDETILGVGVPGGEQGSNLARVTNVLVGLDSVPAHVVSRFCASSAQAIRSAAQAIWSGEGHCFIAAGVESISSMARTDVDNLTGAVSPSFVDAQARTARNALSLDPWQDPRLLSELPDVYIPMGQTAENLANTFGISRQEQDEIALRSQILATHSTESGFWAREISPIETEFGLFGSDESIRSSTSLDGLAALDSVFRVGGSVTAGNSCPLNDGAAAVLIVSSEFAAKHNLKPVARILGTAVAALSPEIMGQGPVEAIQKLEHRLSLKGKVDQYEINEAFAVQVAANLRALEIPLEKVNVNGGSIAIGHPYGMTGARIAITAINSLQTHGHKIAIEAMCVAGGQGMAIAIERID